MVQPDEGEIIVDGEPVRLHGPLDATRRGLAFVHQELTDVPNLTVAENIELGLGYPKVARDVREAPRAAPQVGGRARTAGRARSTRSASSARSRSRSAAWS